MTEADGDLDSAADRTSGYALDGLVTLLGLSRDIGIHSDLDTLLQRVEAAALHVLDCERLTVFLNEPLARELRSRLATGARATVEVFSTDSPSAERTGSRLALASATAWRFG